MYHIIMDKVLLPLYNPQLWLQRPAEWRAVWESHFQHDQYQNDDLREQKDAEEQRPAPVQKLLK